VNKTLFVFETKYGSTRDIVQKLALVLGPSAMITPTDFCDRYTDFDSVVIGSPIYSEQILPEIQQFISSKLDWLKTKEVALFTVGLSPSTEKFLSNILDELGNCVVWTGSFGGVLNPATLNKEDDQSMKRFASLIGYSIAYKDCRDDSALASKAIEIKRALKNSLTMPENELRKRIDAFLTAHNTCALSTGSGDRIRATPIEYTYADGALYFLSEGGEKFANLLVNSCVSVAVFDPYEGFEKLTGLQISGRAEVIPADSDEYARILLFKGLDYKNIKNLPVALNMIKVRLTRFEFLSSELGSEGYDVRQSIQF
jgi:menaquinone-dependent protoporphyrinogen IX oxidase/nitroimidazol reductase NimA-like FMN-containing flavoprotein (pyridoxamine 5'-phosphate oxidase superfamily)